LEVAADLPDFACFIFDSAPAIIYLTEDDPRDILRKDRIFPESLTKRERHHPPAMAWRGSREGRPTMYSVVLATMLSVGGEAPTWHHGCYGCYGCSGCYGGYCSGCSCWGCYGGYASYGCYGCGGCWGCYGGVMVSTPVVYGCTGCCGGAVMAPANYAQAPAPIPAPMQSSGGSLTPEEVSAIREFLRTLANKQEQKRTTPSIPPIPPQGTTTPAKPAVARISVKLPADARLWIDHVECPLTSTVRAFNTPPLTPGQTYAYTLRVQLRRDGETVTDRQRVIVAAGRQVDVDFTRAANLSTASR
jgi:uncharacterized protein (TIGR03000 family)